MFGTLHYNAGSNETQYVERSDGVADHGGNTMAHFACDTCRAKKLKCDGQKQGCFRCQGSSTRCSYTRYGNKKERQRKHDTGHRTRSLNINLSQSQILPGQRTSSEPKVQARAVSRCQGETSCHPVGDIQTLQCNNTREGNISSPGIIRELGVENEQLLFDEFLPDLMSNFSPQDEDPFNFDFEHPSTDGTTSERLDNSSSHRLPRPEPASSSPRLSPILTPFNSVEDSTPPGPAEPERPKAVPIHPPDRMVHSPEPQGEGSADTGAKAQCQCPQAMFNLLEESESEYYRVGIRNMHIIIAQVKNALRQCKQVLDCNHCSLLSDHMMLAAVVLNKVVSIMGEVSRIYIQRHTSRGDFDHQSNCWNLSIGDYSIDLEVEWAAVMKVLITILLERTLDMLDCLKRIAKASLRETQLSMLGATEQKARKVALNMQSGTATGHRI